MKSYLTDLLMVYESHTLYIKLRSSFMLGAIVSPFAWFIHLFRYHIIKDPGFLVVLFMCIFSDLILGIWKHIKLHTFDWKRLYTGLIEKVGISFLGMLIFSLLVDIKEWERLVTVRDYIILIGKLTNLLYVAGSAFNSMFIITAGKFPPIGWMKRMQQFDETLDTTEFTAVSASKEKNKNRRTHQ